MILLAAITDIMFSSPLALLALASVIPLIILYLLRPRTIDLDIPSLLFFLKREQQRNKLSLLLRKLIRDPLFIIQLLVLILLSLAAAAPYIMEEQVSGQHTVIVIDNSASMQAGGRLDEAKVLASERLSAVNSLVWAQNVPVLAVKEGDKTRTKEVIALTPQRAISADIAAAITYGQRLAGPGGTVIVFSDFATWSGDDPLVAKGLAEYNGVRVEFVQVGGKSNNIGIVNGWLEVKDGAYNLNLAVKNFNDRKATVSLDIKTGNEKRSGTLSIPAGSTRAYIVSNLETGITEISITGGGELNIDDIAYVYIPVAAEGRVLLVDTREQTVTGTHTRTPTRTALELLLPAGDVEYSSSLPQDLSGYGIVILGMVDNNSLGPDPEDILRGFVDGGGVVIATASPGLTLIEGGLLPINITGISNATDLRLIRENPITVGIPVTDQKVDLEVVRHIRGNAPEDATVLMEASDASPMLSYRRQGEGTVVYLGLNDVTGDDAWSGFAAMPQFPLIWKQMLDWLGGTDSSEHNVRTGTVIRMPSTQTITYPDGSTLTSSSLWVDQAGLYHLGPQVIAANLYDARESDVNEISLDASDITSRYIERPEVVRVDVKKYFTSYLIWVVLGLIILELIIIKRRRELS
jgi:hypothetical protein